MSALAERPLIESSYMYSHLGMSCLRSACGMCALCERESWRICHGVGSELHVLYIKTRSLAVSGFTPLS